MDIVSLETRNKGRDWPMIVMAIPCSECGAPIGEPCRPLRSADNPMLAKPAQRIDYHAKRKYEAASLWYAQQDRPKAEVVEPVGTTEPDKTIEKPNKKRNKPSST